METLNTVLEFMIKNNLRSITRLGIPTNSFNGVTFYRNSQADKEVLREFKVNKDNGDEIIVSLSYEDMKSLCF